MITACMDDWSAHVNVYMVYGCCVNADWRYQDKKALLVIRSDLTWKKLGPCANRVITDIAV